MLTHPVVASDESEDPTYMIELPSGRLVLDEAIIVGAYRGSEAYHGSEEYKTDWTDLHVLVQSDAFKEIYLAYRTITDDEKEVFEADWKAIRDFLMDEDADEAT